MKILTWLGGGVRVLAYAGLLSAGLQAGAQMGDGSQAPPMAMGAGRMVRGTITAMAADKLTLKTEGGEVYTVALTPNTQLRKGRDQVKLADVHAGDGVGAMGEVDAPAKTVHALFVAVVSAEDIKKAREAMGKTFISGTVTAMDETKLTILRTDQVSQVIQVDEDTSFRRGGRGMQMVLGGDGGLGGGGFGGGRRGGGQAAGQDGAPSASANDGGESITLADIKVGNVVAGPGAIKNGVFVAKTLAVSDPAVQRQRRRTNSGAPSTTAPSGPPMEFD